MAKVGEAKMDMLIGARKDLGDQPTGNRNLIRSRVVMFADLPGFKVRGSFDYSTYILLQFSLQQLCVCYHPI